MVETPNSEGRIEQLQASTWNKVCLHIDGIAIGSTVYALARHGVFSRLRLDGSPLNVTDFATEVGARAGYFHLAMRLLAAQGFVKRMINGEEAETTVCLTPSGMEWLRLISAYELIPHAILQAVKVPEALAGRGNFERNTIDSASELNPDDSPMGQRVRLHVQGHLVAAIMKEFVVRGLFDSFGNQAGKFVQFEALQADEGGLNVAFQLLAGQGWAIREPGRAALTPEGGIAALMARQYYYPVSYLPTFQMVPKLLFGGQPEETLRSPDGTERHVDRKLDIKFSGLVFNRICRDPFMEVVLPLFDRDPVEAQPRCVVDTGSGDGTLLAELYRAIRERTMRGKVFDRYPLLMVGAEYNRVAQETTEAKLASACVPHLTLFGDIGNPDALARELSRHGIDPLEVLHVSKSVIHNRMYAPLHGTEGAQTGHPLSTGVFVSPSGDLITARDLECDLVEHFRKWLPWTTRHGMVVIEAHTVDPEITASRLGRNIITYLDASHGYSHQYLVEVEVFRRAAEAAGYRMFQFRDLATHMVGKPVLSISYFVPRELGKEVVRIAGYS